MSLPGGRGEWTMVWWLVGDFPWGRGDWSMTWLAVSAFSYGRRRDWSSIWWAVSAFSVRGEGTGDFYRWCGVFVYSAGRWREGWGDIEIVHPWSEVMFIRILQSSLFGLLQRWADLDSPLCVQCYVCNRGIWGRGIGWGQSIGKLLVTVDQWELYWKN